MLRMSELPEALVGCSEEALEDWESCPENIDLK